MNFIVPPSILNSIESSLATKEHYIISRAPGRINLIGEHTDYNNGLVLPGAINKYMYFGCVPNGTATVTATAIDKNETITFDLANLSKTQYLWADFLIGILLEFKKIKIDLTGFDCAFTSELPIGAGMSSSSALECAMLLGLQQLYNTQLDNWELIRMSQSSNHNFLSIKGGIMDQFASMFGKKSQVMFLDCATSEFQYIPLPDSDYTWLLINTCVKHNHLTSGYKDRVSECHQAVQIIKTQLPEVNHLSDIKNVSQLDTISFESEITRKRAYFVVEENARVRSFVKALTEQDWSSCGQLLYASHRGLSDEYEVSCDELDFLVAVLKEVDGVLGSRMMGGGFGGCTINLVDKNVIPDIKKLVSEKYKNAFNTQPQFYEVQVSAGARAGVSM